MGFLTAMTCGAWLVSGLLLFSAWRGRGLLTKLQRALVASIAVAAAILLSLFMALLHASEAFSGKTLIAEVTTRRVSPEEFELTYTPAEPVGRHAPVTVPLRGNQWALSGGIVKWHPWLAALGLKSYQAPRWLSGQFSDLDAQRAHAPSLYPLQPGFDPLWEALYWADPYLPGIDAVYGSSAYAYVEPGRVQQVFVTPSGYMIARAKQPAVAPQE